MQLMSEVRTVVRLLVRSLLLPIVVLVAVLLSIANVTNSAQAVRADYATLEHTKAEYAKNGMDFAADLVRPPAVTTEGTQQTIGNLARYDYSTLATAVAGITPASSVSQSFRYFDFLVFPTLFFLVGLWTGTVQRRYGFEKVTLVRAGPLRATAARQLALVIACAAIVLATLLADVAARAVAVGLLARDIPLRDFPPLGATPADHPVLQWLLLLLIAAFFAGGGLAVGTAVGSFALPALLFVAANFVLPIALVHDPRNWFAILGHTVFHYDDTFQLVTPVPLGVPIALGCALATAVLLLVVPYGAVRMRNPRAS